MSSWDISKVVGNHDYFSDINPRNMRRLMNIVYITGRLLRAFSIEFQWLKLASWVYITEQWPYRISWVILYFEREEANLEDNLPLKVIYDRIKDDIPTMKEVEPLLEIDRNPRKFDVFLSSGSVSVKLTVADMRLFLLFAINLDPYLRKIIKENMQVQDNLKLELNHYGYPPMVFPGPDFTRVRKASSTQQPIVQSPMFSPVCGHPVTGYPPEVVMHSMTPQASYARSMEKLPFKLMPDKRLSSMTVEEVCEAFKNVEAVSQPNLQNYLSLIADNNVNGQVLLMCDLDELKKVMGMNFGDWEMFRLLVLTLREREYHAGDCADISIGSDTPVDAPPDSPHVKFYLTDRPQPHLMRPVPKYPTLTKPEQPGELNTIVELSRQQEDVPIVTVSSCHTIQDSDADDEDNDGMGLDTARSNMLRNDSMLRQVEHESNMLHTVLHNSCLTSSGASSDSEAVDAASQVTPDNGSRYSSDDEDDDDLHKPPHRHGDRSTPRDREMVVLSMPVAVDDDDDDGLEVLLGGAASSASSESGYPDRDSDDDDGGGRGRHAARDYQTEDDDDTSSLDEDDLLLHRRPLSRHDSLASHSVEMLHKLADKVKLFVAEHSPHHTGGATFTRSDSLMEDLDERLEMQESATQGRGAGAGTPASTPDTASTTRTATVTPDAGSLTPAVSPDSSSVPPVGSPLSYTTAPAGSPLSYTTAPAGSPLSYTAAPAGSPLSYTTAPAGSPLLYTTAPAGPADVRPPSANDPTCSAFVEVRRCGDAKVAPPVGRSMSYEMLKGGQRHLRCVDGSTDSLCATHEPALMCAQVDPVSGSFHSELVARQPADVAPDALQGSVV
ncbi:PREDICTED: kinase D-interacting substrate of 220 kDa-like isoform X2 [Priapulus caudatus]|uniref:Kinase D-interacting substrate of 220 kDa-like isoform X2 n=1 Tax=Priapulus caudatus TaxID=37621 RepID=A0ABM1EEM2_PRICU|nr:PREDICTED: kinase D-interacting substrate of 220 kDa-like isoform X2 [Priapulus caudatus]